jgi:uncharacterized protein (TIGR03382 family)
VERSIGLAFTTLMILAPLAHAAHPRQAVKPEGTASPFEFVAPAIAHSFGLDHEMLPSDPMTYLDYDGDRRFQNRMVLCGEYADRPRGVNGSTCRQRLNSVALLTERLGARGTGADPDPAGSGMPGGCTAAGGLPSSATALALLGVLRRRRRG